MPQSIVAAIISILKNGKYAVLFSLSKATDETCSEYPAKRWLPPWDHSSSSCSRKLILLYQWISLFVYNYIQVYDSVFDSTSSLLHVFDGSFPVLYGSFSFIIIMLKIKAVLGTNIKQKLRAVSCTIGGHSTHRFLPLISQLLLLLYLHKEKLLTQHKEGSTFYFQRRGNSKKHRYNGRTRRMPALCQTLGLTKTARNDHHMLWSRLQSHPTQIRFARISE